MTGTPEKAKVYASIKRRLWLVDLLLTLAILGGFIASGWAISLRDWTLAHVRWWPAQAALYAAVLLTAATLISLPLDWYRGFALEHRFELSNQKFGQWLWEKVKGFLVGAVLGVVVLEGFYGLLVLQPERWWWEAAILWLGWSVVLTRVMPTWLMPIFYKQKPLEDADMKRRLEALLDKCGTRVQGIFEMNLSKTTRKANACLCGMGDTRRVIVSDTLLTAYPPEEVEVVMAHELGHHTLHHLGILISVSAVTAGASCFAVDLIVKRLSGPLGYGSLSDLAALPLFALLFMAIGLVTMPVVNGISRVLEAQADRYALKQTGNPAAFVNTMKRLAEQNLAELTPPLWVEWMLYDHPPISKRIAMAGPAAAAKGAGA